MAWVLEHCRDSVLVLPREISVRAGLDTVPDAVCAPTHTELPKSFLSSRNDYGEATKGPCAAVEVGALFGRDMCAAARLARQRGPPLEPPCPPCFPAHPARTSTPLCVLWSALRVHGRSACDHAALIYPLQAGWDGFGEDGEFHTLAQVWAVDAQRALGTA